MYDNLFGSVDLLRRGMQATWLRNEVITNNIANVDTVGYKASEVEFEHLFADALGTLPGDGEALAVTNRMHITGRGAGLTASDPRHITGGAFTDVDSVEPTIVTDEDSSLRYDENNVDIEHEMVELAKNSVEYYSLVNKVNSEFSKLNAAIHVD